MDQETQMSGNCAREAEEMRGHIVSSLKKMWLMGYDRGYEEGKKAGYDSCLKKISEEKGDYNSAINEAWTAAKKIGCLEHGCLAPREVEEIFGIKGKIQTLCSVSAIEAITKIKEYEERQKLISSKKTLGRFAVGDILEHTNSTDTYRVVVTYIEGNYYTLMYSDGSSVRTKLDDIPWRKIGAAPAMDSIMNGLRGIEDEV